MHKLVIAAIVSLCALQAHAACEVSSWHWREASYSKKVIKVDMDMKGCKGSETVNFKIYEKGEFLGSATTYVSGGAARYPLDIKRPTKGNTLTLETFID